MKVLLIGGTGVLSTAVTAEVMRKGIAVTMINRGTRKIPDGVEAIISNNKNYSYIKEILKGRQFDAVIDFLCYRPDELRDSFDLYSSHTKQYFFISSCAVYDTTRGGIYEEEAPKVRKEWPYSVDKWECECLLMEVNEHIIVRGTIGTLRNHLDHYDLRSLPSYFAKHNEYSSWEAHRFVEFAKDNDYSKQTWRQKIKYRFIYTNKLGPIIYFLASYFFKGGFLDGASGFYFIANRLFYFYQIQEKIKLIKMGILK